MDSAGIANAIAGFVIVVIAPLGLKYVKLDGPTMVWVSYLTAFLVAGIALLASGQVKWPPDFSSVANVVAIGTAAWGLQQLVYQNFKDHGIVGPLVT